MATIRWWACSRALTRPRRAWLSVGRNAFAAGFRDLSVIEESWRTAYDLIVIDHPHVGQITNEKAACCRSTFPGGRRSARRWKRPASASPFRELSIWQGRQWAFPIDAATQIEAFRPDQLAATRRDLGGGYRTG